MVYGSWHKQMMAAVALVALLASAEAKAQEPAAFEAGAEASSQEVYDPLEPMNRAVQGFNDVVDQILLRPVATLYRNVVPSEARTSVTNALQNLNEPNNALNALLQGDPYHMFASIWRFILNSTLGVGGLFDFAGTNAGLQYRKEDFGQTMGYYGMGNGPYLVLPLMGPSNGRDAVGLVVDAVTNPFSWVIEDGLQYSRIGLTVVDAKERSLDFVKDTEATSFDPYATYRSAYTQYRAKQIADSNHVPGHAYPPRCR